MTAMLRKVKKRARAREAFGQTYLELFLFPLAGMFSDGKRFFGYKNISLCCFLQEHVWSQLILAKNFLSLPGQNRFEFPRSLWWPSLASLPCRTWQQCQVPVPSPTSSTLGQGAGLSPHKLWTKVVGRHWGSRNNSVFTILIHIESNFWGKVWFLCSFFMDTGATALGADTAPSTSAGSWADSLNPACLLTASAHPCAPPQRVVPSSLGCWET